MPADHLAGAPDASLPHSGASAPIFCGAFACTPPRAGSSMTLATSNQRLRPLGTSVAAQRPDAASVLALVAIACAGIGLAGWLLHLDAVVSFVNYTVVPKFNAVLVLGLLGAAIVAGGIPNG